MLQHSTPEHPPGSVRTCEYRVQRERLGDDSSRKSVLPVVESQVYHEFRFVGEERNMGWVVGYKAASKATERFLVGFHADLELLSKEHA